jgi:hypothetical protein
MIDVNQWDTNTSRRRNALKLRKSWWELVQRGDPGTEQPRCGCYRRLTAFEKGRSCQSKLHAAIAFQITVVLNFGSALSR